MKRARNPTGRILLASLAVTALFGPAASSGCNGAGFYPISDVNGLRVLAVQADEPYASPGATVHFTMTLDDGLATAGDPGHPPRPLQILWIGGCVDPEDDNDFDCYPQLASEFEKLGPGSFGPGGIAGTGDTFSITLPEDIISRRPKPSAGSPYYGIEYVFFAVCAGTLKVVSNGEGGGGGAGGGGAAGNFPLGCFDDEGNQLGADSFVPGYTQVYAFADGRTNANPPVAGLEVIQGATIIAGGPNAGGGDAGVEDAGPADGGSQDGGAPQLPDVVLCDVSEEARREPAGCGRVNALKSCLGYFVTVVLGDDVSEVDPTTGLHEAVWVDYFADQGDLTDDIKLVWDPSTGLQTGYFTIWTPPPTPGPARLWAVLHDSRGGVTPYETTVMVQ